MGCGNSNAVGSEAHPGSDEAAAKRRAGEEDAKYDGPGDVELAAARSRTDDAPVSARGHSRGMSTDGLVAAGLRQKRKAHVIFGESNAPVEAPPAPAHTLAAKDAATVALISAAVRDNPFFAAFGDAEIKDMIDAMDRREVAAGDVVIKQGDAGDNFYAIEMGTFEIFVNDAKVADWGDAGTGRNRTFGELALLYNLPRAATVRATSSAVLWFIDRVTFRRVVAASSRAAHLKLKAALRSGLLEGVSEETIDRIAGAATTVKYAASEQICAKGEDGEVFYIIESGSVICRDLPGDQSNNVLQAGDYFGEVALLRRQPRCANVFAETDVTLIAIYKDDFDSLFVDSLRELLEYNMGMRLLLCTPVLGGLAPDARTAVFAALSIAVFKDGDTILQQGTAATHFFVVKEGRVMVKRVMHSAPSLGNMHSAGSRSNLFAGLAGGRDSRESTATAASASAVRVVVKDLAVLSPGHWFPDRDLDRNTPVNVTYVAQGDVQVFMLDRDTYLKHVAPWKLTLRPPTTSRADTGDGASTPRAGAAAAPSGGSAAEHASPYRGPGETVPSSPRVGYPPQAAGGAASASSSAAVPGPAARPAEARRFSTDYKPHATPVSPGGSAGALPPLRRRLGIPIKELELKATVGTGTFGRVRLAFHRKTNKVFALKMLQKHQIVALRQQANILSEKDILMRVDHPFIIKLYDTYRDRDRLYMLLEIVQGGELFSRLQNSSTPGRVSASEARFYSACVLDSFDYLHSLHIIYRDLKPENLLIDSDGYLKLVDFGFAKIVRDRTFTLCGTPEYLAPELVLGRGHDKGVDYWALGILLYEQVAGYSPFADRARNDQMTICKNILKGEVAFPSTVTDVDLKDVILRLLVKDVSKRLGCLRGGAADIKAHRFFRVIDWDALRSRSIPAPWKPALRNAMDTSNFDPYDERDNIMPYTDDDPWDAAF